MSFPYLHANGGICCSTRLQCCPRCEAKLAAEARAAGIHQEDTVTNDYSPIDSYAPSLAKLRAASATPESTFAERYAAERRREFEAEYAAAALRTAQQPRPRLTAAEQAQYAPPDPYQPALDAMRKEQR